MYLKLLDVDKFVDINLLREVTDPIYLEHGKPTPNGLFSHEIFGITQYDRSTIWSYVDLGESFLHPLAASNFKRYGRKFENIIFGIKNYRFENGDFIEDPEGETGLSFLYDNYDNIKWKETDSVTSNERIKFLKQGKDKLFITKFPVTPPFYRDINETSTIGVPEVNKLYKNLISQVIAMKKKSGSFVFFGNMTKRNIQQTLIDIFEHYVTNVFSGKHGIMRRNVMGVDIDRAAWLVMSSAKITGERYTDMPVSFDRSGVPLAALCSMGYDFVVKGVKDFFDNEFLRGGKYRYADFDGSEKYLDFIDPENEFSEEYIKKKISSFIKGHATRFETIDLPENKQGIEMKLRISGRFKKSGIFQRYATWTDVLYLTCHKLLSNKYVMTSRYPIEDFQSIFYTKPHILTTLKTSEVIIDDVEYKHYPVVHPDEDSSNAFINTITISNVYLKALGADFDGDSRNRVRVIEILHRNSVNA